MNGLHKITFPIVLSSSYIPSSLIFPSEHVSHITQGGTPNSKTFCGHCLIVKELKLKKSVLYRDKQMDGHYLPRSAVDNNVHKGHNLQSILNAVD